MKLKHFLLNLTFLVIITISNFGYSQVFTALPTVTGIMHYTYVSDDYNLAIVGGFQHYKSVDQGVTWTQMNSAFGSGLYQVEGYNAAASSASTMYVVGLNVSTNTYVVVRTTDGGTTWNLVHSSSPPMDFKDIAANGNTVVVTTRNGIYRSSDAGDNWTFVELSSGNEISSFVRYNESNDSWVVGGYSANLHVSYDDGVTWQESGLGFPSSAILAATCTGDGILFSKDIVTATEMVLFDASGTADVVATIPENLVMNDNNNPCKTGAFLANGRLLTHNQYIFYVVDTLTQHVYHITYPTASGYFPQTFSIGSSYGIAVGTSASGTQSVAYRINLSQPATISVPSYFDIAGPGPCAGGNIVATANANYADSVRWYINNVLVSTNSVLTYPTPAGVYTTYNVKLNTYYHGVVNTTTKSVVMTAPSPPHTFTYTVDQTACYGEALHVLIDPNPGTPINTAVKIMYNGQLVAGPFTMTSANINAYTTPLTTSGTLQIIAYKTLYCDPNTTTFSVPVSVGPDLFDFEILTQDSVVCTGVNPVLSIAGTSSLYSYEFFTSYSVYPAFPSEHTIIQGNSFGALNVQLTGQANNIDNSPTIESYGPMYMYINLEIADTSGCSPARVIDTIRVQRPTAYFDLHARSILQSDTVHLSNAFVSPNRLWSSTELDPVFIQDETDTIPLIVADTTGFFGIELRNEPLAGCVDSVLHYVHYANEAPEMDTACSFAGMYGSGFLHRTRMDQFGNIYEIRANSVSQYFRPWYVLRKNDPLGNLLWEKSGIYNGMLNNITGIVVEEMDFDEEGNPVVGIWINGTQLYQDDIINYGPGNVSPIGGACYIAKLDKETGNLIWRSNLGSLSADAVLSNGVRITDVVVDGSLVHTSTYAQGALHFFTLNCEDGSFVNSDMLTLYSWTWNTTFGGGHLAPGSAGNDNTKSYWSPQLDVLSTGEVIAVGHYGGIFPPSGLTVPHSGTFVMKYHPDNGIYDIATIAHSEFSQMSGGAGTLPYNVPKMFVDKHDNITVARSWEYGLWQDEPLTFNILDSLVKMHTGTFVVNLDAEDYQMNWLSIGTHSCLEDMVYVEATDETYLACKTRDNFSMGAGSTHLMAGEEAHYELNYTSLPADEYRWLNYPLNQGFITRIDSEGKPVEMKEFDYTPSNPEVSAGVSLRLAASPCGDLAVVTSGGSATSLEVDGQVHYVLPELLFQHLDCISGACSFMDVPDTLELCGLNGIIAVQLSDYYNLSAVTYDRLVNGTVSASNQSATVLNGQFYVPVPAGGNGEFTLVFSAPNNDTMVVTYTDVVADLGTLEDTICTYHAPVALTNPFPAYGVYSGEGVTANQFNPASAGLGTHPITYTYTNANGCAASDTLSIVVDACASLETINDVYFQVYPNPFSDELHIVSSGSHPSKSTLVIYDQIGRVVFQREIVEIDSSFSLRQLSTGNYMLEILSEDKYVYRTQLIAVDK